MKALLATTNPGKVREIRRILPGTEWIGLDAFPGLPEAVEDGSTFEENAGKKALHYHRLTGLLTVAEDSGLEVDALQGEPGILSARYGGLDSDAARCRLVLGKLRGVPAGRRTARFVSTVAVARDGGIAVVLRGEAHGRIADEMRGTGGFGYDPIFLDPASGKTFGEMAPSEKDAVSHRRKSLEKLRDWLPVRSS